jgi:DNA-directed RNA polymerase subunit RPC12/RpoP
MQEIPQGSARPESMTNAQAVSSDKVRRFRCPGCGADLQFAPEDGCLTCPYCGRQERIAPATGPVEERPYEDYLRAHADSMAPIAAGALEVSCQTCGATVTFTPPMVAGECDFCGSPIVAQPRDADPVVAPEGVLPFKVTSDAANGAIRDWLGSLWFAPNALKRLAQTEGLGGVYIPFWTYDAYTQSRYEGERGEHYYTTESYTETDAQGNSVTKTRQVRHTRWWPASGTVERWFDDILVPATKSLQPARLAALAPWDLTELTAYDPAYLSGYKAQRYQVSLPEGFELAKQQAAPVIEQDVRRDIGGDEQRVTRVATAYSAITFKHLLLPVYVGAYRFGDRVFQLAVNGRTGEVQGERPYSFWKILFFVLTLMLVLALAVIFIKGR